MSHVGKLIRQARMKCGMSQVQLSQKLKLTTGQYISNVERGLCSLSFDIAKKVCRILSIDKADLAAAYREDYLENLSRVFRV
jgi:ribosome-binding protein aMBF1 (putative translation factor)